MAVYESLLLNTAVPQIQAAQAGDSYVMVVNATTPALRITQTGTGNALEVEDSANPDSSPFVVTAAGDVGIGTNAPNEKLEVLGNARVTSASGTTGVQIIDTSSGGKQYTLISSGAGNVHSIAAGSFYIRDSSAGATRLVLDASGNLGLGVTPKTDWSTDYKAMQFGASGALSSHTSTSLNFTILATNQYINSAGTSKFINDGYAPRYLLRGDTGEHYWYTTNTSTAGQTVSNTQAMTLDASGNLGVGTTSPAAVIHANAAGGGSIRASRSTVSSEYIQMDHDGSDGSLRVSGAYAMIFHTNGGERARITSGGDLLVGTQTSNLATASRGVIELNGASTAYYGLDTGGTLRGAFYTNGSIIGISSATLPITFGTTGGTEWGRFTAGGNFSIGGTVDRATTAGEKALNIFNGTAPVGTLADGISIYSSSGEAYVMDAAGNATLFSPHDSETNEWIFKSKHTPSGKVLKIDVEKMLRFINDHFGLDAIHEFTEE